MRRIVLLCLLLIAFIAARGQTITYRYWVDNDVSTQKTGSSSSKETQFDVSLNTLAAGLHSLHLQVRKGNGAWSSVMTRYFVKASIPSQASSARYWFDNDDKTVYTSETVSGVVNVELKGLRSGLHALHYQMIMSDGSASVVYTAYFYIQGDADKPVSARYWFDNDDKTVYTTEMVSGVVNVETNGLQSGLHALHYQVLRESGSVSTIYTAYFCIQGGLDKPVTARYWFDNDERTLHELSDANGSFVLDLDGLHVGLHAIHYQSFTQTGMASSTYTRYFYLTQEPNERLTVRTWFDDGMEDAMTFDYNDEEIELSTESLRRGWHTVTAQLLNQQGDVLAEDSLRFEIIRYKTIRLVTGFDTYCSDDDLDFNSVEGLKAYIIAGFNRKSYEVMALRVTDVPANEGLFIEGIPGEYKVRCEDSHSVYANLLCGVTETVVLKPQVGNYLNYVLTENNGEPLFAPLSESIMFGPEKAYLHLPSPEEKSRPLRIVFEDDTDGIKDINDGMQNMEDAPSYDLQGRRINSDARFMNKGIYIINGKKIVNR